MTSLYHRYVTVDLAGSVHIIYYLLSVVQGNLELSVIPAVLGRTRPVFIQSSHNGVDNPLYFC